MKIVEIFYSVQGEGLYVGQPAIFIRLAGCNLACHWCDSEFSWKTDSPDFIRGKNYSNEELIAEIIKLYPTDGVFYPNLVFTGGEPMMQQKQIQSFLKYYYSKGFKSHIEVETNGTIKPSKELGGFVNTWNLSPKFESSGNDKDKLKIDYNYWIKQTFGILNFKFVITEEVDVDIVKNLDKKYKISEFKIDKVNIILMVEGINRQDILDKFEFTLQTCKENNYIFCPRLQILLWGNKQGV